MNKKDSLKEKREPKDGWMTEEEIIKNLLFVVQTSLVHLSNSIEKPRLTTKNILNGFYSTLWALKHYDEEETS